MKKILAAFISASTTLGMIEIPLQKAERQDPLLKVRPRVFSKTSLAMTNLTEAQEDKDDYRAFEISNFKNAQYYGNLYIGSNQDEHQFIFDTGSPYLWVASSDCKRCHTDELYQKDVSSSFKRLSNKKQEINYETGYAAGYYA